MPKVSALDMRVPWRLLAEATLTGSIVSCRRVFTIADTHFGHLKIALTRGFKDVEEHDRALVSLWNATVNPKDTVRHLGDVYFGGAGKHGILGALNGIKHLVMGNHDKYPLALYQQYFNKIEGVTEYRHCVLSHMPVHPNQFPRYERNIHGHSHSKKVDDPRYICVSAEQTNLRPVLFDTLLRQ